MNNSFGHQTFFGHQMCPNQLSRGLQPIFGKKSVLRTSVRCPKRGTPRETRINTGSDIGHFGHPYRVAACLKGCPPRGKRSVGLKVRISHGPTNCPPHINYLSTHSLRGTMK